MYDNRGCDNRSDFVNSSLASKRKCRLLVRVCKVRLNATFAALSLKSISHFFTAPVLNKYQTTTLQYLSAHRTRNNMVVLFKVKTFP